MYYMKISYCFAYLVGLDKLGAKFDKCLFMGILWKLMDTIFKIPMSKSWLSLSMKSF